MRRCRSVSSTRLPPSTIPTPHARSCPLPAALVCQRSTSLSPAGSCSPSPASLFPRSSACTPRPGLVQRKNAALQGPGLCTHRLAVHKSLSGPFLPPLRPLCHNTSTAITLLPGHPPPGGLLQAEAVTTLLGIPRNKAKCIISAQ